MYRREHHASCLDIIALLLLLLFGGLGAFVAKVFFLGLIAVLILTLVGGFGLYGRHRGSSRY
jgi:uncharacterized membrane-anchored protein